MKSKYILSILFFVCTVNSVAQKPLLEEIRRSASKLESKIKRSYTSVVFKDLSERYHHFLFIPFLYVNNLEYSQALMTSKEVGESVMTALRKQPTLSNLHRSENFPHHAIFYDDSLQVSINYIACFGVAPPHAEALLSYYKSLDAQLLFYIWGLNDLFVLIDNRIYQLAYNEGTNSFSKVEL